MTRGLPMLMLVNKLQVDQHSEMADELLRKIFILANRTESEPFKDVDLPTAVLDYVPTLDTDTKTEPTEEDHQEDDPEEPSKEDPIKEGPSEEDPPYTVVPPPA
ncbi:hypothetical protein Tco_0031204 [Tanacetum coccineum]